MHVYYVYVYDTLHGGRKGRTLRLRPDVACLGESELLELYVIQTAAEAEARSEPFQLPFPFVVPATPGLPRR